MAGIFQRQDAYQRAERARAAHLADVQTRVDGEAERIGNLIRRADGPGHDDAFRRFDDAFSASASHDIAAARHGGERSGFGLGETIAGLDRLTGQANAALSTAAYRSLAGDADGCRSAAERCRLLRREIEIDSSFFAAAVEKRLFPGEYAARQAHFGTQDRAEQPLEPIDYARPTAADTRISLFGVKVLPELAAGVAAAGAAGVGLVAGVAAAPVAVAAGGAYAASTGAERFGLLPPRQGAAARIAAAGAGLAAMVPLAAQWLGAAYGHLSDAVDMVSVAVQSPTAIGATLALTAAGASMSAISFMERRTKQADMAALETIRETGQTDADVSSQSETAADRLKAAAAEMRAAVKADQQGLADHAAGKNTLDDDDEAAARAEYDDFVATGDAWVRGEPDERAAEERLAGWAEDDGIARAEAKLAKAGGANAIPSDPDALLAFLGGNRPDAEAAENAGANAIPTEPEQLEAWCDANLSAANDRQAPLPVVRQPSASSASSSSSTSASA